MTSTTPVPSSPNPVGPAQQQLPSVSFAGSGSGSEVYPLLFIDQGTGKRSVKPGTWNYLGQPVERPSMVFLAKQDFRKYFTYAYGKAPAGLEGQPFGCSSWDGENAFGYGERVGKPGQQPAMRACFNCRHEEYRRDTKDDWCAPTPLVFGMIVHEDSDLWSPFFYDGSGKSASPTNKAFGMVKLKSSNAKKQADGSYLQTKPIYSWCFTPALVKNPTANGWWVDWRSPSDTPPPDAAFVGEFQAAHGAVLWNREIERRKAKCLTLGGTIEATVATGAGNPEALRSRPEGLRAPGGASGSGGPAPSEQDYVEVPF